VIGWLDCSAGASGDMLLAALHDAGVPLQVLQAAVSAVAPEAVELRPERVTRHGIGALRLHVDAPDTAQPRPWRDVRALVENAPLAPEVRHRVLDVFARLARAEATAHRVDPEDVHFHEVGALDAIADIAGVCAGFAHLGLAGVTASPVALGSGSARGLHGVIPARARRRGTR
jgi:uncharacterized protein (DUF111 family)